MTKKELLARARELDIAGRSRMSAEALAAAIDRKEKWLERINSRAAARDNALVGKVVETSFGPTSGIAAIKKVRSEAVMDDFEFGTVLRWTTDAGYNVFLYAALKTPVGWATTARSGNAYVDRVLTFEELLEILGRAETTDVRVVSEWTPVA